MINRFSAIFSGTIVDLSKRQNVVFWISQVMVILSTVIGVYLATSEGLRSAVDFHYLTTLEKKYYTLNALRQELAGNNDRIEQYLDNLFNKDEQGNIVSYNSIGEAPDLNSFVWKTLQNTSDTLDLPVDILQDANRYYLALTELIANLSSSHGNESIFYGQALYKQTQSAKTDLLTRIAHTLSRYQAHLKDHPGLGEYSY